MSPEKEKKWILDNLIAELEKMDKRLLTLTKRKAYEYSSPKGKQKDYMGFVSEDELQALKYRRCLVLNRIFEIINGENNEQNFTK